MNKNCRRCNAELILDENWSRGNEASSTYICKTCMLLVGDERHQRVRRTRGNASSHVCRCGAVAAQWATVHGRSGESPEDYVALCRPCHKLYDRGRKLVYA